MPLRGGEVAADGGAEEERPAEVLRRRVVRRLLELTAALRAGVAGLDPIGTGAGGLGGVGRS